MPLVAAACAAYAAGLAAGLLGAPAAALVPVLLLATALVVARRPTGAATVLLAAGGGLVGSAARDDDRRCRLRFGDGGEGVWMAEALTPLAADRAGRVRLASGRCSALATVLVRQGRAPAGAFVRIEGRLVSGGGASARFPLRVDHAAVAARGAAGLLPAWRARARRAVNDVFRGDAPLAAALLVADTRDIPREVRDRFAASGLVHVLSISGLHVAIVAGAVELLARAARVRRRPATLVAAATTLAYVALLGWPPPACRAGVMLAATAAARLRGVPTSPWATLALGAGAPLLVEPRAVLDLGWQLSVSGVAALGAAGPLGARWIAPRLGGWRGGVARGLLASTVATLVTAPLVTWHFGQLSLVGPLSNLAAGPVVALLQPALFLALLLAPLLPAAHLVADAAHPLLAALDGVAAAASVVPGAAVAVQPSLVVAVAGMAAATALVVAAVSRFPARALVVAGGALVLAAWAPALTGGSGEAELHVVDVGQGDAVALRTPRGRWVVFDAGPAWRGGDAGRRTLVPYLRRRGGAVLAFVLTHPHLDHVGGAAALLASLRPAEYWDGAYVGGSAAYRASLDSARNAGVRWRRVRPGDSLRVDGVLVRVLAPDSAWLTRQRDANEASVVALATYGRVRFLLMGDAEREEETWILAREGDALRADVLKVGHHGSHTSSTPSFLAAVRPRLALVSVGAGNEYGHPSATVVRALAEQGTQVLRTDQLGTLVVRTDGRRISVHADDDQWLLSPD